MTRCLPMSMALSKQIFGGEKTDGYIFPVLVLQQQCSPVFDTKNILSLVSTLQLRMVWFKYLIR